MGRISRLYPSSYGRLIFSFLILLPLYACNGDSNNRPDTPQKNASKSRDQEGYCPLADIQVSSDKKRRLAIIVGVGQYKNPEISDLPGSSADAKRFYDLLTQENGYGFPENNVCLLTDENASLARFRKALKSHLVERVKAGDVIALYFAGLGSRSLDQNGDEPDFWDETLMFHDARTSSIGELIDDEFFQMIAGIYEKTQDITVFLDTCSFAEATRQEDRYRSRCHAPIAEETSDITDSGDGNHEWAMPQFPGVKLFYAGSNNTAALERNGRGLFTDALITTLTKASDRPATYADITTRTRQLIAAESIQRLDFAGDETQGLFGGFSHTLPISWKVKSLSPQLTLHGPPIPGLGVGAEFRIYSPSNIGTDTVSPAKAKATVVINDYDGITATAHIVSMPPIALSIMPGDLAVLTRPSDRLLKLNVSLRAADRPAGIDGDLASDFESALTQHHDALNNIRFVRNRGAFEISLAPNGGFYIYGPENQMRTHSKNIAESIDTLWQFSRQRALAKLQGEGGNEFREQQSLQIQLLPAEKQPACAIGEWIEQQGPHQLQNIPLCHQWRIKVSLASNAGGPLLVGGFILTSDGHNYGLPADGQNILLQPGNSYIFEDTDNLFANISHKDVEGMIMLLGSKPDNPVPWALLTQPIDTRKGYKSGLYRALDRYLTPGSRGVSLATSQAHEDNWTISSLLFNVSANSKPVSPQDELPAAYAKFDIRPYQLDIPDFPLNQLLSTINQLTVESNNQHFVNQDHAWSKPSDSENLHEGINSSRSIWYAFTRARLPYNRDNRHIPISDMVVENSLMNDQFVPCNPSASLEIGDILVYHDSSNDAGLSLIVVDPSEQIAWGATSLDVTHKELLSISSGAIEFQAFKFKKDWKQLGLESMELKACWRHKMFADYPTQTALSFSNKLIDHCVKQCPKEQPKK